MNDWYLEAACRNSDPESFSPDGTQWRQYLTAKKVCRSCPVRGECLAYALTHRIEHGVWGGKDPVERRRMAGPILRGKGDKMTDPRQVTPQLGSRVWDSMVDGCGTIVRQEGREWIIVWDQPTRHPGRWDTRPGKCPWFSLAKSAARVPLPLNPERED